MCKFVEPLRLPPRLIERLDFVRTGNYDTLSGVLLAITGCEALFAK